jgi:hypothetical protein
MGKTKTERNRREDIRGKDREYWKYEGRRGKNTKKRRKIEKEKKFVSLLKQNKSYSSKWAEESISSRIWKKNFISKGM